MQITDLGGNEWRLQKKGSKESTEATVPGCVHTDLLEGGKIEDPFYRDNEQKLMWIGESDWIYTREFEVDDYTLSSKCTILSFEGLDTLADIYINGKKVASTDNMFRTWEFEVGQYLKKKNTIKIVFASAVKYVNKAAERRFLMVCGATGDHPHKLPHGSHLRKEQCNFGWDWGPMCVTAGIWRPIKLISYNFCRMDNVYIKQNHEKKNVDLDIEIKMQGPSLSKLSACVKISYEDEVVIHECLSLKKGKGSINVNIKDPELWWPNGMGNQNLYDVEVEVYQGEGEATLFMDSWKKRIGIRTLELIQEDDQWGRSFCFSCNGIKFFAKGANWIPADVFQTRVTNEIYEEQLQSAQEANMNFMRVWGGGIYEEDYFYDLCDELGICIWQDFMFACSAYPADVPEFMENIEQEAIQNVQRIRHHASIALYCGNNELEQCHAVGEGDRDGQMTWTEYKSLFDKLLPKVVKKHHGEIAYWPSSEHTPVGDRIDTSSPASGDGHLWDVWHGQQPFEWYRTSFHRFCSEYGFQSFPEPQTTYTFTEEKDRNITSRVMELHQRSDVGNSRIMDYMLTWYRLPIGFENTIWLSQIQQGLAIKYAVEHWRRNTPRCMGSIYWQMNDCWPVASWASIDSLGNWKALQYMAKRFYETVLLSAFEDKKTGTVELHVSSDQLFKSTAELRWYVTTSSGKIITEGTKEVKVPNNATAKIETLRLKKYFKDFETYDMMIFVELYDGKEMISSNFSSFERPKYMELEKGALTYEIIENSSESINGWDVIITAEKPALWCWLEVTGKKAAYSDNFICLRAGQTYTITVKTDKKISETAFKKALQVKSIVDSY
jgi:beta-mannosidase